MKGDCHYLKHNANTEIPSHFICLDTETWTQMPDEIQRIRLWSAVYLRYDKRRDKWNETWGKGRTAKEFHAWLNHIFKNSTKKKVWMASHNMAYDFPVLEMDYYLQDWKMEMFVPGHPFLYYASKDKVGLQVISTTNWYAEPLREVAPIFGSHKDELPMGKLPNGRPDFDSVPDDVLEAYNHQDTVAVADIVKGHLKEVKDHDLGCLQATIASQAFSTFRHRFMGDTKLMVHHIPALARIERESYRGGRTEALFIGEQPEVYELDVNSMYPAVMRNNPYPTDLMSHTVIGMSGHEYIPEAWSDAYIIARCEFTLKEPCIGVHRKQDGKLLFPVGNIKATLSSPEINYINNHPESGEIVRYLEAVPYEQHEDIFKAYVDFFNDMKINAKTPAERSYAKKMLNALYGKMGQRLYAPIEEVSESLPTIRKAMEDLGIATLQTKDFTYIQSGSKTLEQSRYPTGQEANNSVVRIASGVTAYSRIKLWEVIKTAGLENVYYCDTDSIATNAEGRDRCLKAGMVDDRELGKLKCKGPLVGKYHSPKHYELGEVHKNKGIRRDAKWIEPCDKYPTGAWEQDQFCEGKSRYRQGVMDGVRVRRIVKEQRDIINKGTLTTSGRVLPFVFRDF